MASRISSLGITRIAVAGAAATLAVASVQLSGNALAPSTMSPWISLSPNAIELTSLSDITVSGISNAFWSGWGGYIGTGNGTPDAYYPNINPTGSTPVYVTGVSGVVYYIVDEALTPLGSINLDNYFFEVGSYYGGKNSAAAGSGLSAVLYVGASEAFGSASPIAQLAKAIFYDGVPAIASATIVQLAEQLPTVSIGPVKVGGGILTSLYFTGQTPSGNFSYGTPGWSAIAAYVSASISGTLTKPTTAASKLPTAAGKSATPTASLTGKVTAVLANTKPRTPRPTSHAAAKTAGLAKSARAH